MTFTPRSRPVSVWWELLVGVTTVTLAALLISWRLG